MTYSELKKQRGCLRFEIELIEREYAQQHSPIKKGQHVEYYVLYKKYKGVVKCISLDDDDKILYGIKRDNEDKIDYIVEAKEIKVC